MANRYTKYNSNYLMRTRHQKTNSGTIMERDWVTTNSLNVLRFGPGRRIWYNSGNFVFTTSNVPSYHKKHKLSTEVKEWNWDDCKDADDTVNTVKPNYQTNDIRDYAYYGSCVELIRSTIEDIITDFPGRITMSTLPVEGYSIKGVELKNEFNIDLHHKLTTLGKYDNELRFMSNSWYKYCFKTKDGIEDVIGFTIGDWLGDVECPANNDGRRVLNITFKTNAEVPIKDDDNNCKGTIVRTYKIGVYSISNNFVYVYDSEEEDNRDEYPYEWVVTSSFDLKNGEGETIKTYNVNDIVKYHIYKQLTDDDKSKCVPIGKQFIAIQPKEEYIDEYFNSLRGFKSQILRRDTKPFYSNKFKTPIEYNFNWYYPEKMYIWPSDDYCIRIDGTAFYNFMNRLIDMGSKFDELWSDNIYRSMTHESIKNFDWTYSREYYEGEEQDNIDGGERMMKILRVFGRVFDDIKYYIDNIRRLPNTTYDRVQNGPEAMISDNVALKGVDLVSTIGKDYDINATIERNFFNDVTKDISWCGYPYVSLHPKWYPTRNSNDLYPDVCDNELMRRFTLSMKRLMQTKGTQHSIDMVMGFFGFGRNPLMPSMNDDYFITEEAFYTEKLIPYNECVNEGDYKWTEDEDNVVDWKLISKTAKGDVIGEINNQKDLDKLYYNDPYSGLPLRTILIGHKNEPFVVPYYDPQLVYDGNLVYQQKGGWGKFINLNDNEPIDNNFDYQETLSYLHVIGSIGELLAINPRTLKKYDIYYVVNLNDYTQYDENPPIDEENGMTVSHYFVLMDLFEPHKLYSWKNLVVKNDNENNTIEMVDRQTFRNFFGDDEYAEWYYDIKDLVEIGQITTPSEEQKMSVYEYAFRHMEYLENILSTNLGNNPHVGYGNYDDGMEFLEYMEQPFKYAIDNFLFSDISYLNIAKMTNFNDITEKDENGNYKRKVTDKIQIFANTKSEYGDDVLHINQNDIQNDERYIWYINTKIVTIKNNVSEPNEPYKVIDTLTEGLYYYDGNYYLSGEDFKEYLEEGESVDDYSINDNVYHYNNEFYVSKEHIEKVLPIGEDVDDYLINTIKYKKGITLTESVYKTLSDDDKKKCIYVNLFKEYFRDVIMPYLMQVIPSTTILKLEGF